MGYVLIQEVIFQPRNRNDCSVFFFCLLILQEVAVKLESQKARHPQLLYESKLYKILQGGIGIPKFRYSLNETRAACYFTKLIQSTKHQTLDLNYQNCLLFIVWFQKISIPPPRRELEIPKGRGEGGQRPRKFQKEGGLYDRFSFQRSFDSIRI